jgi:phosphoglycolate phosphatase-like HAD superfamily hydrolase
VKLVLFDIDGTLLWTDGAGRRSMEAALIEIFNCHGDPTYRYDGKTDKQIAREQLRRAGIDDRLINEGMDELLRAYVRRLERELERDLAVSRLCAGVPSLLDAVEAHARATMGLLTGNIEHGARRKLRAVGVEFERFRVNAFGSDHEDRPELPAIAQQRAQAYLGTVMPGDQMVIIGDTPADIECGRALGVRAIGVATGRYTVEELAAHRPAAVFETLEDTDAVLAAILG